MKNTLKNCFVFAVSMAALFVTARLNAEEITTKDLMQKFDKHYGQVEIGGRFAGFEFHKSWPTPSRMTFYYPVSNSIEFSPGYWERYESKPFDIKLTVGNKTLQLGQEPYDYSYVPYCAIFDKQFDGYKVTFEYNFCDTLPEAVMSITLENTSDKKVHMGCDLSLMSSIHTSASYDLLNKADVGYCDNGTAGVTDFSDYKASGPSSVFMVNAGLKPEAPTTQAGKSIQDPKMGFKYGMDVAPGKSMKVILLIGTCKASETQEIIAKSIKGWQDSVKATSDRVLKLVNMDNFSVNDPTLMETVNWSKAEIASLSHYIDGDFISMPCPAEYNFYFTHDLLVTGLGMMLFDPSFAKHGYDFILKRIDSKENVLLHAYYWKDEKYETEFCGGDNWNNLWLIISASSYLKNTGDIETVKKLFPVMTVSINNVLGGTDEKGLICADRPDWWDAGCVHGQRAYMSILTYKALGDYVYTAIKLGKTDDSMLQYLQKAEQMKTALNKYLWDSEKKYLMNELTTGKMDEHYYIGSLMAPAYGLLDKERSTELLSTTDKILLDKNLGVRVAMPKDFMDKKQVDIYHFSGDEQGKPGYYFNGAIWPQGNIWYATSLIANGQLKKAEQVIKKYITIDGIKNSPNGTPSFYETRITDENTPQYGQIDKPSFLWQGGWYMYILYQLAGMRENSWNIYFYPVLPDNFTDVSYKLMIWGDLADVKYEGKGNYFKSIKIDGETANSAVMTSAIKDIVLTRGIPEQPYLAEADCIVNNVEFNDNNLSINASGIKGESAALTVVSPVKLSSAVVNGQNISESNITSQASNDVYTCTVNVILDSTENIIVIKFK